eukprot:CAMPEP_0174820818 /NCGR_PEP_ID=MMETSP1107-20130205/4867_1 /TAXON_ID=36770 /ORGANISM="Paraphysomonas vestita, Strain GFlagA" /LENGTH=230 /DNA_ID=CAMNT_0016036851 /DNA_START=734 /DNA_END=1423 /DNA_ORIENTATION=+
MKHHRLTAEEAIGWLRIVRPGSVIGPQQQFMKDMQARLWREGDIMRQRMGISLPTEYDDTPLAAESKRSGSVLGDVDSTSRLMSNLSLSSSDKKSSSMSNGLSSSKPNLTNRLSSSGRSTLGSTSTSSPEDDGEVTQGDMLRQRRTHGHHLTPAEAKSQSSSSSSSSTSYLSQSKDSKGSSSYSSSNSSAKSLSSTLPSSSTTSSSSSITNSSTTNRPTTRSQISKLLGK